MSTAQSKSPDWHDLLKINRSVPSSQKKKKEYVTSEQREELLKFIQENPEMVTHSSTRENEAVLWDDLTKKLNAMLPAKSVLSWQIFWKRWRANIETKNESSLTLIDYQLMKFMKNVTANFDSCASQTQKTNKRLTFDELCNNIDEVEAEKTRLKLQMDQMENTILTHRAQITILKKAIAQNKKRCYQLSVKKAYWNGKKRKIQEKENLE